MRTEHLIDALVADRAGGRLSMRSAILLSVAGGAALSLTWFLLTIGLRGDLIEVALSARFLFKLLATAGIAVVGAGLALKLSRPGAQAGAWSWMLFAIVIVLLIGVLIELAATPGHSWSTRLFGTNPWVCVATIPALAIVPMGCVLLAMRHGAPTRPRLAGMAAGLSAAGVAAALYALNCTDDSPLFVAAWYSIGIGVVVATGLAVGPRVLRW